MGIYLNPGNENYREAIASGTYVDKTMMLGTLNTFIEKGNKYVCVSRPRRFGKTIAQNMLCAYYSKGCDSREIFAGMKIAQVEGYERNLNRFNVIRIDMNGEYQAAEDENRVLKNLTRKIKREIRRTFPDVDLVPEDTLVDMLLEVHQETGEQFVILIDEYDVLAREQVDRGLFAEYLAFLNGLFKNDTLRPAIALAYLTGILPVVRDRVQSKLNNFREYTILDARELAPFVGFTEDEVRALCAEHGVDFEECRRWYDGYRQHGLEIYNPESVVECVNTGRFENYWGKTSTYAVISDRIRANFEGTKDDVIRMLAGESVKVNITSFLNTMTDFHTKDDVFMYLLHTGYLAYDRENGSCRIPNREIQGEWLNAIAIEPDYKETDKIIKASEELLRQTQAGNEEAVARALDASHINVTSNRSYNNEDALQSTIYLAYLCALNEYTVVKEMTAGKGFADVVFVPFRAGIPAMIVELKRNGSAQSALEQILEKRYFDSLAHYQGELLFVGVNYDEKAKTHACKIERFVK